MCIRDRVSTQSTWVFKIYNQGQISFHFYIKPNNTAFGKLFRFNKTEGWLDIVPDKNEIAIEVTFKSSKVGDFSERFEIQMGEDVNPLIFSCEGKVIAPPMKFMEQELDFQKVPFDFDVVKEVNLINLSNVEIPFEIEIPDEVDRRTFMPDNVPEFVRPKDKAKIQVRFKPPREGEFAASLTVKVPNVAQDFATLPLRGLCQRPSVEISPSYNINFKNVFLRKSATQEIVLTNTSDLRARFRADPQEEESKQIGIYSINPPEGEIEPRGSLTLSITLEAQQRHSLNIPASLTLSSKPMPEKLTISAEVQGPQITVDPQNKDSKDFKDFKDVKVLSRSESKITIQNIAEIPAKFTAFMIEKNSIFHIEPRTGVLDPGEKKELLIICTPDDARLFEDTLNIYIEEGEFSQIKLRARAYGTSICIKNLKSTQVEDIGGQKYPAYEINFGTNYICLLYTSPSPRDLSTSRMPSSA
eukprot:TRINITY_DN10778_c0_g1_i1.p1 TRINITY_DN10778_c0_g1~~TRINITY_DN10778_c0_g1_i1.p1  ORF type:complete len:471 (-),score=80.34 TRINITY_DN10778_c0_g1_i1:142-1554(-)